MLLVGLEPTTFQPVIQDANHYATSSHTEAHSVATSQSTRSHQCQAAARPPTRRGPALLLVHIVGAQGPGSPDVSKTQCAYGLMCPRPGVPMTRCAYDR
ncbi:hypothetical protein ACOMHN_038291 [Nucella lapillus]